MRRTPHLRSATRQRGATLVIALLILVLIMMIGITAVSTSNTQFRLAGNLQFEDSALNNAEVAVAAAENWLATRPAATGYNHPGFTTYDQDATPGLLPIGTLAARALVVAKDGSPLTMTWSPDKSVTTNPNSVRVADGQNYFIELMSKNNRLQGSSAVLGGRASSACNQVNTYLITGRGTSARGATKFIQTFYSVRNC